MGGKSEKDTDSRLDSLLWARDVARESIVECEPDKRSALIGQYRAILAEIAELQQDVESDSGREVNGLVILQDELAKRRQSKTSDSRNTRARKI